MRYAQSLFNMLQFILQPINYVWDAVFRIQLPTQYDKIIVLGSGGGCGKTTLASDLHATDPSYCVLHIDEHKFGEHWIRRRDDEFVERVGSFCTVCRGAALSETNTSKTTSFSFIVGPT